MNNKRKQTNSFKDKTCLNCGAFVSKKFCPECGQKHESTQHNFSYLIKEFIADLVHYDSSFWKTTRYLLTSPAKLSLEYLNGRHKAYVNPVKLYIFISFLAFFIPSILPDSNSSADKIVNIGNNTDSAWADKKEALYIPKYGEINTIHQLDSIHDSKSDDDKLAFTKYLYYKYWLRANENMSQGEINKKIMHFLTDNVSKALFVYMPVFAFWMWLFHLRKRKYFFDSGIFTLHFFSFVLLSITLVTVFNRFLSLIHLSSLTGFVALALGIYITYYFYKSSRRFYNGSRIGSCVRTSLLMIFHSISILIILVGYFLFALIKTYD